MDLGYGNVDTYVDGVLTHGGWDQGPANLLTNYGVFPQDIDLSVLLNSLAQGAQQGFNDFLYDLGHLSLGSPAGAPESMTDFSLPSLSEVVNTLSGAASTLYSVLLPTADVVTSLLTTMPGYNISMFLNAFQGDDDLLTTLTNAIGLPLAADFGLIPTAIGFELMSVMSAVQSIADDFAGLFSA